MERANVNLRKEIAFRERVQADRDRFFNLPLDMMCIAGFDGYFKEINPSWIKILGWSKEELLERPYSSFIHPDDQANTMEVVNTLENGNKVYLFENRYLSKTNEYHWLSWNAVSIQD